MIGTTDSEMRFAERALRRRKLFLVLAIAGLAIAGALSVYYGYRRFTDPLFPIGPRMVIVLLILLNSRQNLRQYRYAGVLGRLMEDGAAVGGGVKDMRWGGETPDRSAGRSAAGEERAGDGTAGGGIAGERRAGDERAGGRVADAGPRDAGMP